MMPIHNDLFRLVSLRGPERVLAVVPTEDVEGSEVLKILGDLSIDASNPPTDAAIKLAAVRALSWSDMEGLLIAKVDAMVRSQKVATLSDLQALHIPVEGLGSTSIVDLPATPRFRQEYAALTDSWLKLLLTDRSAATFRRYEPLIRTAHLCQISREALTGLSQPYAIRRLLNARISPPRSWQSSQGREQEVRERHRTALEAMRSVKPSKRANKIAELRADYGKLVQKFEFAEAIRIKGHRTYFNWKNQQLGLRPTRPSPPISDASPGLEVAPACALEASARRLQSRATPRLTLDAGFFSTLENALTPDERLIFRELLGGSDPAADLEGLLDEFAPDTFTDQANRICREIQLWEEAKIKRLPVASPTAASVVRPLLRAVGWGELVVARERLIGYEAREIAHIENVMPGEAKLRKHDRRRTVEQVTEVETLLETESERDLQTSDRYELRSESQATIQQEYSIEAGVNTSGRYGLTKVETSLQAGFQQSKSEARSSSQQIAREIVSRAVERTFESVRELRRLTVTEQIRELNQHRLENLSNAGSGAPPSAISGIYLWVEKLLEVELRHYGRRMLVEFHIPEPAISLLERDADGTASKPRQPAPFTLGPADVHPTNYLCLTDRFGAEDVQPPPAQFVSVGYAWASAPSEDVDEATAEDTVADTISIPDGYRPVDGYAVVSAHPSDSEHFDVFLAVGGLIVIDKAGVDFDEGEIQFDPALRWPNGVPVSVRAHGHFDKTMVAQVSLRCERTNEALVGWRLRTWEQLRSAHELRMQTYRRAVEEQEIRTPFAGPVLQRPEAENRRVELEELQKWSIKAMRLAAFNFNAVEQVGDFQEIDPLNGDLQAGVTRMFEEAFEWREASYFLYPYYWSRRETWSFRSSLDAIDARHAAFLRAGSARFIVPVTPGFEERVLYYLDAAPGLDELSKLDGPPAIALQADGEIPIDTAFADLWLELLLEHKPDIARGSGTLAVQKGATTATINADSDWRASETDLGRELYLAGEQYTIKRVLAPQQLEFAEPYNGFSDANASYAAGSVPYGPPWVVRVPTSTVILNDRRSDLAPLGS